ncbi:Uncharacterized protein QTN25_002528 [Entamoeba marina]
MLSPITITIPFRSKYLTDHNQTFLSLTPLMVASSTIPDSVVNSGLFGLISAIFDKKQPAFVRWVERPLKYTGTYTLSVFLNNYFFETLHGSKSIHFSRKLLDSVVAGVASSVIMYHPKETIPLIWDIFAQVTMSLFMTTMTLFIE